MLPALRVMAAWAGPPKLAMMEPQVAPAAVAQLVQDLGHALLGRFGFAFELISVVLLLAILGALVVARTGREARRE